MSIKGLNYAIKAAKERAIRTKQAICVVQIGKDEFVLWRWITKDMIAQVYKHYKIIKVIGYKDDFR